MDNHCAFCRIISGEAPAQVLYRDDEVIAFRDIHPVAPVHILVLPCEHIISLNQASAAHQALLGRLVLTARQLAEQEGVQNSGYRLILNTGSDGGQSVFHLHLHLLGGRHLSFRFQ